VIEAKVILLGESGVGKSSVAYRFCNDAFNERHDVTIGAAYMQ
jgi:Rab family protein